METIESLVTRALELQKKLAEAEQLYEEELKALKERIKIDMGKSGKKDIETAIGKAIWVTTVRKGALDEKAILTALQVPSLDQFRKSPLQVDSVRLIPCK